MRTVRLSKTFERQLTDLLDYGELRFGRAVAQASKARVERAIRDFLTVFPKAKVADSDLGLTRYPVTRTPFVLLYDFDDAELRVHFVFQEHVSLTDLDPSAAEW
jgi:plasmid stabilization system protein ParE